MISFIKIKNFAVVEETEIELSDGLNVLTGETGAGKSIIIDTLSLFLKKKIPQVLFRDKEKKLIIEAMFEIEDEEIVFKREASKLKSKSYINGDIVPFSKIQERITPLLNIYGQNEHIFLLNSKNHLTLLDKFCNNSSLLEELNGICEGLKISVGEYENLKDKKDRQSEQIDYLKFQLNELDSLRLEQGDEENLIRESKILSSSEEIISNSNRIIEDFYQGENSIYGKIAETLEYFEFLGNIYSEMNPFKDEVRNFYNLIPEMSEILTNLSSEVDFDENRLNEIETKLLKINLLKEKHKTDLDGLIRKRNKLNEDLQELENADIYLEEIRKDMDKKLKDYKILNEKLRNNRKACSEKLSKLIEKELSKLEMKNAKFEVRIEEREPTLENYSPLGTDDIEFYFSSNLGQETAKIKAVASGGELSRLMLILKSITDEKLHSTYIFDEIDTGIGGKTAEFVGHKLNSISKKNQVICISHLPQIAAFADTHILVKKIFKDNNTFSFAEELAEEERIKEIARLMAGSNSDESILKAANSLIEKTRSEKE